MKKSIITALGLGLIYSQVCAAATQTVNPPAPATATPTSQPAASNNAVTAKPVTPETAVSNQPAAIVAKTPAVTYPEIPGLATNKEKISYSIGTDLGMSLKSNNIDVDPAILQHGLSDALSGNKPLMTKQQVGQTLMAFQKELEGKKQAQVEAMSKKNLEEGKAFLATNKTKPGVITTASGLQYKVISAGKGQAPTDNDLVTVDYSGKFIDGKEFDSSYKHGKPITFPVSEVIRGWTETLKLMQPGATYEIYVPGQLAYGEQGFAGAIGPNQTLIFKIHLISVKKNV